MAWFPQKYSGAQWFLTLIIIGNVSFSTKSENKNDF